MPLNNESERGKAPTVAQRFAGFAECHILYSLISCPVLFALGWIPIDSMFITVGVVILLLLLYFPLGKLKASFSSWAAPRVLQEKVLAVLLPTIVAWIWVLVVLVSVISEMPDLFMVVFAASFLFALPSSLFVVTLFALLPSASFTMGLGVWGLVAGILPPLLFALGSFVQSEKREKGREWLENG